MIEYSISTVRLFFEGREWTRYETANMIEYCAELPSFAKYMFSNKREWYCKKNREAFWVSCEEPEINKQYDYNHANWVNWDD